MGYSQSTECSPFLHLSGLFEDLTQLETALAKHWTFTLYPAEVEVFLPEWRVDDLHKRSPGEWLSLNSDLDIQLKDLKNQLIQKDSLVAYLSQTNDRRTENIKEITYKYRLIVSELRKLTTEGINESENPDRTGKEQALNDEIYSKDIHIDELLCQVENLHQKVNFYQDEVGRLHSKARKHEPN